MLWRRLGFDLQSGWITTWQSAGKAHPWQPTVAVPVYIADNVQWASYYWQFYLAKHGRLDLHRHTAFVDVPSLDVNSIASGGLVFCRVADEGALLAAGMTRVAAVPEPDGVPWFSVLRR